MTCSIPNCGKPDRRKGLCWMHLDRLREKGDVMADVPSRHMDVWEAKLIKEALTEGKRLDQAIASAIRTKKSLDKTIKELRKQKKELTHRALGRKFERSHSTIRNLSGCLKET